MSTQSDSPYLDTRAAAGFLGLSSTTLESWRSRGGGPRYRKFGKAVRYAIIDLQAFADASARGNTSQTEAA